MEKTSARIVPHNQEAEISILSCVLISEAASSAIIETLKTEDFYSQVNRVIFNAMRDLYNQGKAIDFVTVTDLLEKRNQIAEAGGLEYIMNLTNAVPSAANYKSYADIIKSDAIKRILIDRSTSIVEKAYGEENGADCLAYAESELVGISKEIDKKDLISASVVGEEVVKQLQDMCKNEGKADVVEIPFPELNKVLHGLHRSDLIILAARPSVGKTAFALNIAQYAAIEGKKVALFSLEMPKEQLYTRMLSSLSGVKMEKLRENSTAGQPTVEEWQKIWSAHKKLSDSKMYIDDSGMVTYANVLSRCRRLKKELGGLDLITIDYLQLMDNVNKRKNDSRQNDISEISRNLKIIARELNVPLIALSQLSRSVEGRAEKKPRLSDLRESGAIEQDADIVMFLYRPDLDENNNEDRSKVELTVQKHRNGELCDIPLQWLGETVTFKEMPSLEAMYLEEERKKKNAAKRMRKIQNEQDKEQISQQDLPFEADENVSYINPSNLDIPKKADNGELEY